MQVKRCASLERMAQRESAVVESLKVGEKLSQEMHRSVMSVMTSRLLGVEEELREVRGWV